MPRTDDMIPSKFVKKGTIGAGVLWTIKEVAHEEVGREDDPEMKWVLHFVESPKGLALNKTNIKLLESICGSDNTDDWPGKQVVLYWDATIEFMGEIKGGIRIRGPKTKAEQDLGF